MALDRPLALTRAPSLRLRDCQLTWIDRQRLDPQRAVAQHSSYERALVALGFDVERLAPLDDEPDGVFVEDIAVILDEVAILTRPGAPQRRGEVDSAAKPLGHRRPVTRLEAPAKLDGGDVLRIGRRLYVGLGGRSNAAGFEALEAIASPLGYELVAVESLRCLHLKTACSQVGPDQLLLNPRWVSKATFDDHELIEVDPSEPFAGNALWSHGVTLLGASHRRTRARLEARGVTMRIVCIDELTKAEAGLTCMSLLLPL